MLQLLITKYYHIKVYCYLVNSYVTPGIAGSKVVDGPEDGLKKREAETCRHLDI